MARVPLHQQFRHTSVNPHRLSFAYRSRKLLSEDLLLSFPRIPVAGFSHHSVACEVISLHIEQEYVYKIRDLSHKDNGWHFSAAIRTDAQSTLKNWQAGYRRVVLHNTTEF